MPSANSAALNSMLLPQTPPGAPQWVKLLPAGQVVGRDGRAWINDIPDAVLTTFADSGLDIPVDFEHATELLAPKGGQAPACGWVKELAVQNGELWGRVEWTEKGRNAITAKEYRYLSPVIVFDRATNRIVQLISVGLTNRPNLSLPALNRQQQQEEMRQVLAHQHLAEAAVRGTPAQGLYREVVVVVVTLLQGGAVPVVKFALQFGRGGHVRVNKTIRQCYRQHH